MWCASSLSICFLSPSKDTLPKELMPSKGISWKAVALAMKDERLPLDYNRRWMGLRAKVCLIRVLRIWLHTTFSTDEWIVFVLSVIRAKALAWPSIG